MRGCVWCSSAQGRAFGGFEEGALQFRPTYRVVVGSDAYDPKRCPAWTDRVLWKHRHATSGAGAVRCELALDDNPVGLFLCLI